MGVEVERAVVIGASIGGLAAAAGLAARATEVVMVDRAPLDAEVHSTAPQGGMPHVLLASGAAALERLSPGLTGRLHRRGALGEAATALPCRWWAAGATRTSVPDLGVAPLLCSRALLESELRRSVLALPNVRVVDRTTVRGLRVRDGRAVGLAAERDGARCDLDGDLVVDASGRGSRAAEWMRSAGFDTPPTTQIKVEVTYVGTEVRRRAGDLDGVMFAVVQNSRELARLAVVLPAEGNRWQVVLGGYFGDAAEATPEGMRAFAASLPDTAAVEVLRNEWLTEPRRYRFPSSLRRHWEACRRLPAGFCAVGDAVASFNPIYGQGMTSAALQAEGLVAALDRHGNGAALPRHVARAAARVVANPWRIATGADFIYPRTQGRRPPGAALVNRHLERVMRAAASDDEVNLALARVQQLLAPPTSLFTPSLMRRVRAAGRQPAAGQPADVVVVDSSLMST